MRARPSASQDWTAEIGCTNRNLTDSTDPASKVIPSAYGRLVSRIAPHRSGFSLCWRESVRWADVDIYGHVNNVAYYSYVDSAVNGWLMRAASADLRRLPSIGVVAETSCRYFSEIDFPAEIDVGLALERMGTSSITYAFAVFIAGRDTACASGRFVHVYVDDINRRPTPIPEVIRTAVSSLPTTPPNQLDPSGPVES